MDDLRLILLLLGAAVIGAVYAWTRFQSREKPAVPRQEPTGKTHSLDEPDDVAIQQELERMQRVMNNQQNPVEADDSIIVISVVAPEEQPFGGEALGKALDNNDLVYGEKAIYHRHVRRNSEDLPVFSLANMVKPGDFGNGDLQGFSTPGVTLILQLPGPVDSLDAYDDFVQTAERLAVELGGQLQDQKHCVITHQALMQRREKLAASRLQSRAAS